VHDRGSLSPCNGKWPAWDIKPTPVFFRPQGFFYLLDFAEFSKRPQAETVKTGFFIIFHGLMDVRSALGNRKPLIYRLFLDNLDTAILRTP
jgi:hypothetical protein